MVDTKEKEDFAAFLNAWVEDPLGCRQVLLRYRELLEATAGVQLSYHCRPGVSYSMRARGSEQNSRELFVLVDVVDDDPSSRWLSVCFYADLVTDPDEIGDWVPGGLGGEDASCFNYDEQSAETEAYIADRLKEAAAAATRPGAK